MVAMNLSHFQGRNDSRDLSLGEWWCSVWPGLSPRCISHGQPAYDLATLMNGSISIKSQIKENGSSWEWTIFVGCDPHEVELYLIVSDPCGGAKNDKKSTKNQNLAREFGAISRVSALKSRVVRVPFHALARMMVESAFEVPASRFRVAGRCSGHHA